ANEEHCDGPTLHATMLTRPIARDVEPATESGERRAAAGGAVQQLPAAELEQAPREVHADERAATDRRREESLRRRRRGVAAIAHQRHAGDPEEAKGDAVQRLQA